MSCIVEGRGANVSHVTLPRPFTIHATASSHSVNMSLDSVSYHMTCTALLPWQRGLKGRQKHMAFSKCLVVDRNWTH